MWRIENRGENLFNALKAEKKTRACNWWGNLLTAIILDATTVLFTGERSSYNQYQGIFWKLHLKPNTQYTISFITEVTVNVWVVVGVDDGYPSARVVIWGAENFCSYTFVTDHTGIVHFGFCNVDKQAGKVHDIKMEEGSSAPAEYSPPLNQSLESSLELFGYNGVYDEMTSDGLVVKRWNRETVTVSSGSATLSKSGRGNAIVVAVSDGVPYDGTVSGTTLSTSAPDGEYVVIYQLATPDIQKLDYSGELILYPGKNYLVTDSKTPIAISIKGAKKYLEG